MDKPKVGQEIEAQEQRKLNMEEKRKLEKLLIADIKSATARYDTVTQEERQAVKSLMSALTSHLGKSARSLCRSPPGPDTARPYVQTIKPKRQKNGPPNRKGPALATASVRPVIPSSRAPQTSAPTAAIAKSRHGASRATPTRWTRSSQEGQSRRNAFKTSVFR